MLMLLIVLFSELRHTPPSIAGSHSSSSLLYILHGDLLCSSRLPHELVRHERDSRAFVAFEDVMLPAYVFRSHMADLTRAYLSRSAKTSASDAIFKKLSNYHEMITGVLCFGLKLLSERLDRLVLEVSQCLGCWAHFVYGFRQIRCCSCTRFNHCREWTPTGFPVCL
jgi:hypothetical protein